MDHDTLTFYQSGLLVKKWRWRYQAAGNSEKLANGSQGYKDLDWALTSAFRVCGLGNVFSIVADRRYDTTVRREEDDRMIEIRFR